MLMMPRQSRNYTVQLTFSTLDIEQEMNCNWDYLGWGPAIGSIDKRICGQMPRPYLGMSTFINNHNNDYDDDDDDDDDKECL